MKKSFLHAILAFTILLQFQSVNAQSMSIRNNSPTVSGDFRTLISGDIAPYIPSNGAITSIQPSGSTAELPNIVGALYFTPTKSSSSSGVRSVSSLSIPHVFEATVQYTGGRDTDTFSSSSNGALATTNNDTSSSSSSSTSSSIRGLRALSTIPVTYLGLTNFDTGQVEIRSFQKAGWKVATVVPDTKLPMTPPANWEDFFSISAAPRGPQLLVAWFNTSANAVRTIFFDGVNWEKTDFPTTHPVKALHCNVSLLGTNAGVGFITQDPSDPSNLIANTVTRNGARWGALQEGIDTNAYDPELFPRIRYGAGESSRYFAWNSGNRLATVFNSKTGTNWKGQTPVSGDLFDFGLSGSNDAGHLTTFSTTDSATNTQGKYYKVTPNKTTFFAGTAEKANVNMVNNIRLQNFSLALNSYGHMMLGTHFNITNSLNSTFSALGSTLYQPNMSGIICPARTQVFAPTGMGLTTANFAQNDLSSSVTTYANALRIVDFTEAQGASSYVDSPSNGNRKYHSILTKVMGNEIYYVFELLGTLSPADSLSRGMQYTTDAPQKGGTYSP